MLTDQDRSDLSQIIALINAVLARHTLDLTTHEVSLFTEARHDVEMGVKYLEASGAPLREGKAYAVPDLEAGS